MIAASRVLLGKSLWVALAILLLWLLLSFVRPSNDVAEDKP